ncbi:thioredoxin-disulfide reductase [Candidatus Bandiella euplotis]|uniref:Thioredoxin reductase n=1 Tax=Candidatus Bandiella euplotis TaxID=1664265 RepID=A0ABZ0UNZ3_9RICK|nr:thioredoxin-disulfide reductase [Candidatus Bandiella woodruffii]WPX96418.1 Thioredoxin-disulfide reductase [Candidatus Bandiella woodruffii]
MQKEIRTKVLIMGSGPAGYSAAIYAARASLEPVLVSGYQVGGQLTITTDVENYPGFAKTIQGPWLMEEMRQQAENFGTKIFNDTIVDINNLTTPFVATGENGVKYIANTIIISTGAQAKWLGIDSEKKFMGFGVSGCATCDGFFYRNKEVLVVGGGNTAVEEALYLTNHASKVTLIHRRDKLKAEKILQERLFGNPKISIMWDSVLEEVIGSDNPLSVEGARIKNIQTGKISEVRVHGIFIAIGHAPNTDLFRDKIKMDAEGYIITAPDSTATSIPGIYAAGDVQDKIYRQAVTAAGTGCMAALEATKFLES